MPYAWRGSYVLSQEDPRHVTIRRLAEHCSTS
jgi:hypothetical protein